MSENHEVILRIFSRIHPALALDEQEMRSISANRTLLLVNLFSNTSPI
jgi:hypothetical protein